MATASRQRGPQGPLRHQGHRRARPRHGGEGRVAAARRRPARPDRARPRRDHRHRHLRHHRRGDRRLRPGDHPVLRPRRRHLRVLRALLRRAGLVDPGLGQRLHVLLRDARRARGVDHRLGPDPRVRASRSPPSRSAGASTSTTSPTRCSASRCPTRSPPRPARAASFNLPAVFIVLAVTALLMRRRPRERALQHGHGVHQARGAGVLHRRSASPRSTAATSSRSRPRGSTASSPRPRSSSSPTSASTRSRPRARRRRTRDATCRSRSSARSRSRPCSTSWSRSSPSARCRSTSSRAPRRRSPTVIKDGVGLDWAGNIISFGALVAITSVVLTILYGQTRIMFAMCRDGLMPRSFAKVNDKTRTPVRITATFGRADRGRRRVRAAHGDRQARQHRHAVRVHRREHRRDHPAPHQARPRARLPRPVRAGVPDHRLAAVRLPDAATSRSRRGCGSSAGWCSGSSSTSLYGIRHSRLRQGEVVNPEAELPDAT